MKSFTTEPLTEILTWAQESLKESDTLMFEVLNPDLAEGSYAGETILIEEESYLHRSYKAWSDLAELLFCRLLTPKVQSGHTVILTYKKIDLGDSFHRVEAQEEKYGSESRFAKVHKNEEPAFLSAYLRALNSVKVGEKKRILNLGINTGDEFDLIRRIVPHETYKNLSLVGIDHSQSAITVARERFDEGNAIFHVHDINDLSSLGLGRFDLIITIGTLQSSTLEFKSLFASLVQEYLAPHGAMILGFPNCRWMGGEMIYGAKAPNYPYSEMSILIKDIYYCKKYLQQKKFRVTVTGRDYLFLTATKIA
ncbi:class I SAM-dependent methyltransferase [Sulfuricurvum sp.]|uniref:class I SAM-dependent methyltransferase n=1 Tax=Sulfuricurvum sp. TaxID=2025608 RepID=UPI002E30779A|nr:methyltransferase domain-containing protein [Sulfuricurvum sp.]HEX5330321.1 methyltransferase domain-containing protein [Sulfuricurvum sp.]